ncbi:winged helix DNA-binding protein [Algihabitans albus]|uniref:winged helix DNA-binding protein n=1 Tax=Algihabitans albus TaxID=2164067 RepID=UPI001F404D2B|nr:winged helix DNA-binding protein [Algihabitans albus]
MALGQEQLRQAAKTEGGRDQPAMTARGDSDAAGSQDSEAQLYREITRLVERMHRRLLDVVRIELNRQGIDDVSPSQVLMLLNIGSEEVSVRDLIERGYYLASNASYNLKALHEGGYIDRSTALRDKRAARIKLSEKGLQLCVALGELETLHAQRLVTNDSDREAFENTYRMLRNLEMAWSDAIRYGDRQFL